MEDWSFGLLETLTLLALAASGYFWLRRRRPAAAADSLPAVLTPAAVEQELQTAEAILQRLDEPSALGLSLRPETIRADLAPRPLRVAVLGGPGSGKSSLVAALAPQPDLASVVWQDGAADRPDLVLWLVAGDLSASEYQDLQALNAAGQTLLLVLSQSDRYLPDDRDQILAHLRQRCQSLPAVQAVQTVAAAPGPLKVRQHYADGSVREWLEPAAPDLAALSAHLRLTLGQAPERLRIATALRQARALSAEAQAALNQIRRTQALSVVERYQWIAAATVFANPLPGFDLLATAAVNAQMLMEIAAIYEQSLRLTQAKDIAKTLAVQMLKLGLVELSTQGVGALLKTNVATYAVGGLIQAVSAAYLTHLGAQSFLTCLEQAQGYSERSLGQTLQALFQQNQRTAFLQGLVQQGIARLLPATA